ncbi:MAG: chloride channel protein, partial [Solirubrobacteraceae bacterium]
ALYAVVAMGGVFAAAAQAPLTSIASVAEMTGNFTLALPIMLACGIAGQLAKRITHGSIYTTKLLRRGIDIERPRALSALQALTVDEVMQPVAMADGGLPPLGAPPEGEPPAIEECEWERLVGPVTLTRDPQALFAEEDLEQARRQLVLYGRDGLPVLSRDGRLRGWLTRADLLRALASKLSSSENEIEEGAVAAEFAVEHPSEAVHNPSTPLLGYQILELRIPADSPARGRRVADIAWPPGCVVVAVTEGREIHAAHPDLQLTTGERVIVLAPTAAREQRARPAAGDMAAETPPRSNDQ